MKDELKISIFVSSPHYGLEDLRGELASYLAELGVLPLVSSENGFPDHKDLPPYVQCLRVLEKALMVLGVIDRRYGQKFDDWKPYGRYKGLSPTHAELRHSLSLNKRTLVYHRDNLQGFYEIYKRNKDAFESLDLPDDLEIDVLKMFSEIKHAKPAPWIEAFRDVRDIKQSMRKRLLFDLYEALSRREMLSRSGVEFLLERILKTDSDLLRRVLTALDAMPESKKRELERYLDTLVERKTEAAAEPRAMVIPFRNLPSLTRVLAMAA